MTAQPIPTHTVADPGLLARHLTGAAPIGGHVHRLRADYVEATGEGHLAAEHEHEHEQALAADAEFRYQAEGPRAKPLTVTTRSATAYAWGQAHRLYRRNPLVLLVYLAAAEDADRGTRSTSGYSCVLTGELAAMLGLQAETVQPSVDDLVVQGLLLAVPAVLRSGLPTIAYRVNDAHLNAIQR